MLEKNNSIIKENARILMLSQRADQRMVSSSCLYEFEDLITKTDTVDMYSPILRNLTKKIFWYGYKYTNKITSSSKFARFFSEFADSIIPNPNTCVVEKEYDLFFAILSGRNRFSSLNTIKNWRKKCRKAACYVIEFWQDIVEDWPFLELLKDFDHIFLAVNHSTNAIANITGRPCTYLPPGVDTIKFCPYPHFPHRSIDVCYIGRRSPVTHKILLNHAERENFFYFYDTSKNFNILEPREHRLFLANTLKRSRYFVANKANADQVWKTGKNMEVGYRFFEGAAAGTLMIGAPPTTDVFNQLFDWSDAVIRIPFNASNIIEIIKDIDTQSDRLIRIRQNNIINSLLKHDWIYRWKKILEEIGLEPTQAMLSREKYLQKLANEINECYPTF